MILADQVQVLLIEDNPTDVLLAHEILDDATEFRLHHAERLGTAIERLASERFDIVLLDLGLPDSQGLETLLKLREQNPTIPVVVLTGQDDEDVALRAVHLGAQDYLVKSFVQERSVRRAIRYAIERNQSEDALRERAMLASLNAEVGLAFTRGGSLRQTLTACAESIVNHLGVELARIWILNASENTLELQASAGIYTTVEDEFKRLRVGELRVGRVASERQPYCTNNLPEDPFATNRDWALNHEIVAFAGYPLLLEDRMLGVLAIFGRRPLSDPTLESLASVANYVALGVEREHSQNALLEVNRTLQSLFDAAPVAISVLDTSAVVLEWNATAERMFGWTRDEVVGQVLPIVPEGEWDAFVRNFAGEFEGNAVSGLELHRERKDGSLVEVTLWTAPIHDEHGKIVASIGIFVDATETKKLEQQLRQAQKMEAVGSLAGGIAHDFNNLLTIIGGYSEMARRKLDDEHPALESLEQVVQASDRAASLTRQLLAFSRRQMLEPKVLSVNRLISDLEKMLRRLIGEDVSLTCQFDAHLGEIRADAGQIEQVVMNLVVNARDAMPQGGQLTVETRNVELSEIYARSHPDVVAGPHVMIAVSDTGTGIDSETLERIFEPFFTTKEFGKGTGLGLATVYGIVKQSGGHVTVYSEPGVGTTFKIYLPRVDGKAVALGAASTEALVLHGDETILLAEDEELVRKLARTILETQGYTVLEAHDGQDALRVAETYDRPIHLLLTDVVMPKLGGARLAEELTKTRPDIRVLYLSGYTDDAIVRHGILSAEKAFLQKPFTPTQLAMKIRSVLDQ